MGVAWKHNSHEKLVAAGYTFVEDAPCKSDTCGKTVKWYRTPKDHMMPFDDDFIPHFAKCKSAADFTSRGKKGKSA